MKLTAPLQGAGKTATGIQIPDHMVESLGAGRRPKVVATINGYSWRSSIAFMGGAFWLGVSAENRAGAGVVAGDMVDLDVEFDAAPRTVEVPADLAAALDNDPAARTAWDRSSYTHQRQHITAIEAAKAADTRQRRVAKVLAMLRDK